jgi:hypothetical protein
MWWLLWIKALKGYVIVLVFGSPHKKRHGCFERTTTQMNIKFEKRIALDWMIRCNSIYLMLSTALEYKPIFEWLASKEKICAPFQPNKDDWDFAREFWARLKIFYDATQLLLNTIYVKANIFLLKLCGIYLTIEKWRTSSVPKVEEMSALMKENLTSIGQMCMSLWK